MWTTIFIDSYDIRPSLLQPLKPSSKTMIFAILLTILITAQPGLCSDYSSGSGDGDTKNPTTSAVLVDNRKPEYCNSPGWEENPSNIKALVGAYVYYKCRNKLSHSNTKWLLNGRTNILQTRYANRVSIQNNGRTLRFGPIIRAHDGLSINCEVLTYYGYLPSPLGHIEVISRPSYNPSSGIALITKPFYFDFKYSGSDPDTVKWYKNGYSFAGERGRVFVDSNGITFTRVLQRDSGLYYVKSQNKAGSASASSYLRVVYWWRNGTQYQHAASTNPDIPVNVAVAIAIDTKSRRLPYNRTENQKFSVSTADSSAHAFRLMRRLNNKATNLARRQGHSRQQIEEILKEVVSLVGHPLVYFDDKDTDKVLEAARCSKSTLNFNCKNETVLKYRTINGTCNNMFYPLNGAAHSPFSRLLPGEYEDRISEPYGYSQLISKNAFKGPWPSARYISWKLIRDLHIEITTVSHMFMAFGQFLDHDMTLAPIFPEEDGICGCNVSSQCLPILVKPEDPTFGDRSPHMGECIPFTRSIPVCSTNGMNMIARNQINQLTSFIDASTVYGSENKIATRLRLGVGGLLKEGGRTHSPAKGNLPFQEERPPNGHIPFFDAGDERVNEQLALTIMHTIWMREHNRIARRLGEINNCWDDEKIYQETRKIVGAMMQVITYNEFLPVLFGDYYEEYIPKYQNYNPFVDATVSNAFSAAAFRFGHSLVRPSLMRLDENYQPVPEGPLPLEDSFFNPIEYFKSNGTDPVLRGLLVANAREVDEFVNNILTSKLFTDESKRISVDLASLNIQRGRDHGLAPYRKWQRFCESAFPGRNASFKYRNTENLMKAVYGYKGYRDGMDLWVGSLSEKQLPGAQVGPTFACILGLTFAKVRDGDRFWYQNPHVFRYFQRREIEKVSLSRVICNNADNITDIQKNAFAVNQAREPCSALSDVNLNKWKDYKCSR